MALVALALSGCAAPACPAIDDQITDQMRSCPGIVSQPVPPAKPRRSIESIAIWGNEVSAALAVADARLLQCDAARSAAVRLLEDVMRQRAP